MLRVLITGYLSKIYKPDASATVTIILSIRSSKIGIMSKKCVFCLQDRCFIISKLCALRAQKAIY